MSQCEREMLWHIIHGFSRGTGLASLFRVLNYGHLLSFWLALP